MSVRLMKSVMNAIPPGKGKAQVFVTIAPGLENSLIKEFSTILNRLVDMKPKTDVTFEGGFEVALTDVELWWLLHTSRTMESARVRLGTKFVASNFKQLQSGLEKLPWGDYISNAEKFPNVRVSCQKSKLYHSGAVQERVKEVVAKMRKNKTGWGNNKEQPTQSAPDVHVRLLNDVVQVSVDVTSNEHYRRTGDKHVTEAPLRETIAASLLTLANYKPGGYLWDPFMGSGTIINEALSMTAGGAIAPLDRSFPMETWPSFDKEKYLSLLEMLPKPQPITELSAFGSDISKKAIDATTHNLSHFQLPPVFQQNNLFFGDFEEAAKTIPVDKDVMIVTNVPYGHRLLPHEKSGENQKELKDTLHRFSLLLRHRPDLRRVFVLASTSSSSLSPFSSSSSSSSSSPSKPSKSKSSSSSPPSAATMIKDGGLEWVVRAKFDNRGIPVELLQLKR